MTEYNVGDQADIQSILTDKTGALVDPDQVEVQVKSPAGLITALVPVRQSAGVYTFSIQLTQEGNWFYRVACAGSEGRAAAEGTLYVRPSEFF